MGMSSKHDSLQDSEDIIEFLQQENMELKRLLEVSEEEKQNMCLMLQNVVEEQTNESCSTKEENNPPNTKQACGHGKNATYDSRQMKDASLSYEETHSPTR